MKKEPSSVLIKSFRANGQTITAKNPFTVEPVVEGELRVYKKDDIGLDCFITPCDFGRAHTLVLKEMAFLWRSYALEVDAKLDDEALQLKKNLLAQFAPEDGGRG